MEYRKTELTFDNVSVTVHHIIFNTQREIRLFSMQEEKKLKNVALK